MTQGRLIVMVRKLQDHFPLRICDWLISGILLSWGLACLAAPSDVWELPINHELANLAPQFGWGTAATALGMIRLGALFVNGAMRRSPHLRAVGAFFSLFLWMQLTLAVLTGHLPALAAIIYPWLLIGDFYNVYRAAQDAKFSDSLAQAIGGAQRDAPSP